MGIEKFLCPHNIILRPFYEKQQTQYCVYVRRAVDGA